MGVTIAERVGRCGEGLRQLRAGRRGAGQGQRRRGRDCRGQQLARRGAARAIRHRLAEADVAPAPRDAVRRSARSPCRRSTPGPTPRTSRPSRGSTTRGYVLNGRKVWVANADGRGPRDRVCGDAAGRARPRRQRVPRADGQRRDHARRGRRLAGRARPRLHGPRVSSTCASTPTACSGAPGDGFRIAMWALEGGRVAIAAQALGVGEAALDAAVEHAQNPRGVRSADRQLPGDSVDDRRHGDRARRGADADDEGRRRAPARPADVDASMANCRVGRRTPRWRQAAVRVGGYAALGRGRQARCRSLASKEVPARSSVVETRCFRRRARHRDLPGHVRGAAAWSSPSTSARSSSPSICSLHLQSAVVRPFAAQPSSCFAIVCSCRFDVPS